MMIENEIINEVIGIENSADDEELYRHIQSNFLLDNKKMIPKLEKAIQNGYDKLAYQMVHTLKGTAQLIGAKKLARAATDISLSLSNGENAHLNDKINILDQAMQELFQVLEPPLSMPEVKPTVPIHPLDKDAAVSLIDKLKPLLAYGSPESIAFIEEIRNVLSPLGKICDTLIILIENYDFNMAFQTLCHILKLIQADS